MLRHKRQCVFPSSWYPIVSEEYNRTWFSHPGLRSVFRMWWTHTQAWPFWKKPQTFTQDISPRYAASAQHGLAALGMLWVAQEKTVLGLWSSSLTTLTTVSRWYRGYSTTSTGHGVEKYHVLSSGKVTFYRYIEKLQCMLKKTITWLKWSWEPFWCSTTTLPIFPITSMTLFSNQLYILYRTSS